jgi:hypothetical protein
MWRLWTKGWGVRSWWYWMQEATPRNIAMRLPMGIAYWAYVRVVCAYNGDREGDEFPPSLRVHSGIRGSE